MHAGNYACYLYKVSAYLDSNLLLKINMIAEIPVVSNSLEQFQFHVLYILVLFQTVGKAIISIYEVSPEFHLLPM